MPASPWDANWGMGNISIPTSDPTAPANPTPAANPVIGNADPWKNPFAGMYEGDGPNGDPRAPGNFEGIGDWKSIVNKVLGPGDVVDLIQKEMMKGQSPTQTYGGKTIANQSINWQAFSNLRRAFLKAGMDPYAAAKLEEAFNGGGAAAHDAAYKLGLYQQFKAGGYMGLRPQTQFQYDEMKKRTTDYGYPTGTNTNYTGKATPAWDAFGGTPTSTTPTSTTPVYRGGSTPALQPGQRGYGVNTNPNPFAAVNLPTLPTQHDFTTPVNLTPGPKTPMTFNPFDKNPWDMRGRQRSY